jgi:hypothetical protein
MRHRIIIGVVICMAAAVADVAHCLPTEPSDSWVYPYLYELRLRLGGPGLFTSTGPYERGDIARWVDATCQPESSAADRRSAWLGSMLSKEFESDLAILDRDGVAWTSDLGADATLMTDTKPRWEGVLRLVVHSGPDLCMWTSLRTSANAPDFHKTDVRMWKRRGAASFDHGGIAYRRGRFSLFLGRDELSWGAERRTGLLFSGSAPSLDMVKLGFRTRRFCFTSFHSRLRDDDESVNRFVSGHRLEVLFHTRLTFSVSEAVVYGGEHRLPELRYINPLTLFYAEQWNAGTNDNILIAADLAALFPGKADVRFEVMFDDFQYDFETEPHEFAAGLSIRAINPLHPEAAMVGGSYFHVRNQTYGHFVAWNRFLHEGRVMGYPGGPDGDRLRVWASLAFPREALWTLDYTLRRRGEGRAWDTQEQLGRTVKFPSGVVDERQALGLEVEWRPAWRARLLARIEWYQQENAGHVQGESRDGVDLKLTTSLLFKGTSAPGSP